MKKVRVLLVDDHVLIRSGIRALLEEDPDVEVVGEAADGHEALALLKATRPDLALVDIAMPGLNGLEVAARAAVESPEVGIIILSMHAAPEYVRRAMLAGARGYLRKDAEPGELRRAIETAARGEVYLSQGVSQQLAAAYLRGGAEESRPLERLTPRQREVLQLLARGHRTKEIAHVLDISARTVETYRAQIMDQLDIHDLAGLTRFAIRVGLVTPEE